MGNLMAEHPGSRAAVARTASISHNHRCGTSRGFTLLEALIALVIFGIIMFAISNMLSTTLYAQTSVQRQQEESGAVRAVFSSLQRDLSAAYASGNNTNTVFIAGGGQSSSSGGGSRSASSSLITLTTLAHRIQIDDLTGDSSGSSSNRGASAASGIPQSDTALVRYDLDPQTNRLTRHSISVPSLSALIQAQPGIQDVLADNVRSLTLRFWDSTQNTWRTDWDYETQAPTPSATGAAANSGSGTGGSGSGASGGAGSTAAASAQPSTSTTTGSGDQTLPVSVEITLELVRKNGTIATFMTSVPILAPQPAAATPAPTTPAAGGTSTGAGGTAGTATGGTTGSSGSNG